MPLSTTKFPTIWNQDTGTVDWLNMANSGADDALDASIALTSGSALSKYLMATGFGFASDIPPTAIIRGVQATVRRRVDVSFGIQDDNIFLVKADSRVGTAKAAGFWDTAYQDQVFGSNSDFWGTTIDAADVRNSGFGLAIKCSHFTGTPTGMIDYISIAVSYDAPMSRGGMMMAVI